MDRLFLDANVLFSAAYSETNGLQSLWEEPGVALCTSGYAVAEARRNLQDVESQNRLERLTRRIETHPEPPPGVPLPPGIHLLQKDVPILLCAVHVGATHLLTGDVRHFGPWFGQLVGGVRILRPAAYLRSRYPTR